MDATDRRLLDALQAAVPLEPRPFAALGAALELGEEEVLRRLGMLEAEGILRSVSAIFDTARLGYRSALVAASAPPERLAAAASVINEHPGVSHNYERDSAWNLWFTLAVPPGSRLGLEATAAHLATRAGCGRHRLLPALRVFKIGVRLDMEEAVAAAREDAAPGIRRGPIEAPRLDDLDRAVVRALQEPFALVAEPFAAPARAAGLSVEELLDRARLMLGTGVLRRVAGLLHHRRAGFTANVMGAWAVSSSEVEAVGTAIAGFGSVSHCYERPTYPDWPYSVFSMIHGRSREACEQVLDAIARTTGVTERLALWTVREFKKVRLRYFTPDYAAWERSA